MECALRVVESGEMGVQDNHMSNYQKFRTLHCLLVTVVRIAEAQLKTGEQ